MVIGESDALCVMPSWTSWIRSYLCIDATETSNWSVHTVIRIFYSLTRESWDAQSDSADCVGPIYSCSKRIILRPWDIFLPWAYHYNTTPFLFIRGATLSYIHHQDSSKHICVSCFQNCLSGANAMMQEHTMRCDAMRISRMFAACAHRLVCHSWSLQHFTSRCINASPLVTNQYAPYALYCRAPYLFERDISDSSGYFIVISTSFANYEIIARRWCTLQDNPSRLFLTSRMYNIEFWSVSMRVTPIVVDIF